MANLQTRIDNSLIAIYKHSRRLGMSHADVMGSDAMTTGLAGASYVGAYISRVLNARRLAHTTAPLDGMTGAGKFRAGSLGAVSKGLTAIGVAVDSYSAYDAFSNGDYGNGYFHSVSAVAGLFPPTAIVAGTANLIKMGIEIEQRNFENAVDRTNTQAALLWVRMNQRKAQYQAIGMMERIEGNDMELLKCLEDCECRK